MAGHVGVDAEQVGDAGGGDGLLGLPHREVDGAPGGIPEAPVKLAQGAVEFVGGHGVRVGGIAIASLATSSPGSSQRGYGSSSPRRRRRRRAPAAPHPRPAGAGRRGGSRRRRQGAGDPRPARRRRSRRGGGGGGGRRGGRAAGAAGAEVAARPMERGRSGGPGRPPQERDSGPAGGSRLPHAGDQHLVGQGRGGQVVGDGQHRGGPGARRATTSAVLDADVWGFSIPRMLGVQEPPAVIGGLIVPAAAHGVRVISMDFFVPPDQAWSGGARCSTRPSSSSSTRCTGTSRSSCSSTCPPARATSPSRWRSSCPRPSPSWSPPRSPRRSGWRRRAALMAAKMDAGGGRGGGEHVLVHRRRRPPLRDLRRRGRAGHWPPSWGCRCWGRCPWCRRCGKGADHGEPAALAAAGSEAAAAFEVIAGRVAALRPRVRRRAELAID